MECYHRPRLADFAALYIREEAMAASPGPKSSPTDAHSRPMSMSAGPGCFPWTALALLTALLAFVFSPLFLFSSDNGPEKRNQRTYKEEISQARQQLFKGQLVYTDARSLGLVAGAEPRSFRVDIRGNWRRTKPSETQDQVSAGAQIAVKLHCSGARVRCIRLSSERQSVLYKNDKATWMWHVSAQHAGKVSVALTVTAYFRQSDTVLAEKPPVTSLVDVAEAPSENSLFSLFKHLWHWGTGAINSLGALAVSATAIAGALVMVIRRRLPGADTEAPTAERAASRRPQARSAEGNGRPGRPRRRLTTVGTRRSGRRRGPRE